MADPLRAAAEASRFVLRSIMTISLSNFFRIIFITGALTALQILLADSGKKKLDEALEINERDDEKAEEDKVCFQCSNFRLIEEKPDQ